jgi:hypothetical protein
VDGSAGRPRDAALNGDVARALPWSAPGWLDDATRWIDRHAARVGEVELVRTRPWSAIARVTAEDGDLWFKESAPALAFEPALTALLAERRPDCVPEVVAVDGARLLTRDVGPQLRALLAERAAAPTWHEIVALYAELQIELVDEVDALLELGVPDRRPETLATVYERVPAVGDVVPLSVIHEEVHDGNVFVRDGRPVFIDWGEASVSHPFAGLVNTLRAIVDREGWEPGGDEILRVRDAYLEPWTGFASLAELRETFAAGYALGTLCRSASWTRTLSPLAPADREEFAHYPDAWLEIFDETLAAPQRLGA